MRTDRIVRLVSLVALSTTLLTPPVTGQGVERFWTGSDPGVSGNFNDPDNWLDGDKLGIPGELDTAIFDLASVYVVTFPTDQNTDRVLIRSGLVTFDLDATITPTW